MSTCPFSKPIKSHARLHMQKPQPIPRRYVELTHRLPPPPAVVQLLSGAQAEGSIKDRVVHGVSHNAVGLWVKALHRSVHVKRVSLLMSRDQRSEGHLPWRGCINLGRSLMGRLVACRAPSCHTSLLGSIKSLIKTIFCWTEAALRR